MERIVRRLAVFARPRVAQKFASAADVGDVPRQRIPRRLEHVGEFLLEEPPETWREDVEGCDLDILFERLGQFFRLRVAAFLTTALTGQHDRRGFVRARPHRRTGHHHKAVVPSMLDEPGRQGDRIVDDLGKVVRPWLSRLLDVDHTQPQPFVVGREWAHVSIRQHFLGDGCRP